jgi:hypothetical protein
MAARPPLLSDAPDAGKSQLAARCWLFSLYWNMAERRRVLFAGEKKMKDGILSRVHGSFARPGPGEVAILLAVLLAGVAGCKVRVDKSSNGDQVKIATPFGGIAVNKDQTSAADLGLPAYPGAQLDTGDDGNKSAKVDLGFGSWKLRVKVAHYSTADNRDQVLAFYRKALSQYGSVIECDGERPVGVPASTGEGLTCDHTGHEHSAAHGNFESGDLQLKAGSAHHQHIVAFHDGGATPTHFSLIALDLPHGFDDEQKGTN